MHMGAAPCMLPSDLWTDKVSLVAAYSGLLSHCNGSQQVCVRLRGPDYTKTPPWQPCWRSC